MNMMQDLAEEVSKYTSGDWRRHAIVSHTHTTGSAAIVPSPSRSISSCLSDERSRLPFSVGTTF